MDLSGTIGLNTNNNNQNQSLNNFDSNFSVLDRYGTYVTKEEYITDPAIGRDEQIKQLILVLLTPEKSAILIGKPGIGKTAIVEGLAYRIQKKKVPDALLGYQIINIKTASLLGTMPNGETKVQRMIDELKTKEKLILFIDEIHMLIGSTESSSLDFANIFKEGLGRGSIKVIGATTTEEYERYILRDKAFTRRFQKIDVPEPTREETIKIMMGTLPKFEKQTGRKMKYTNFIQERIMSFIVDITSEYKRIYALGSRYPDVCLTLLKQAFSYTVYDNRPYMDIFDVRKAIENSKNIYPDVIKKELPNFDKMFNDIMLEEKGEKPIEEWRRDDKLTRSELDSLNNTNTGEEQEVKNKKRDNDSYSEMNLSSVSRVPKMVDKSEIRDSKPVKSIIDSKGRKKIDIIGNADVSVGIKKKLNNTSNSGALDDLLLSSNVSVLKNENKDNQRIFNYTVTDEIRNGVSDDYLFSRPIMSTLQDDEETVVEEQKYRLKNNNKEGKKMWNDNNRNVGFDISNQNFDKYQNYFHRDQMNDNSYNENQDRMNMLMGGGQNQEFNNGNYGNPNDFNPMNNNFNQNPYDNQMYQNMPNNGFDMGMNYMPQNNQMNQFDPMGPPMNNQMNQFDPMGPPMNNQMNQFDPMGPPMNNQMNQFDPMGPPMNNQMNQFDPMGPPMNNQMYNGQYNNFDNQNNSPMIDNFNNNQNSFMNNNGSFGISNNQNDQFKGESLFGAPMYSENKETSKSIPDLSIDNNISNENVDNTNDIFGQLMTNDMQIKNGEIVTEFPTFDKINNLSNITASMNNEFNQNQTSNNYYQQNNMPNNQFMMGNQNNSFGMNQMMPAQGMNKNWMFVDNGQNNNFGQNSKPTLFQKNILDEVKKKPKDNNMASKENTTMPTNNNDYYEDMKKEDFVNFSDINKGKVKEEDANKYMGVQVNDNKPQFDLNLESNQEEEKFDDFYE